MPSARAVAPVKQLMDGVGELFAAEEGVDKLAAPVRLVAAGEAAGYDQHLAAAQGLDHALKALLDVLGAELRTTSISGSAPARRRALAVSNSQLVPGRRG